jgi:16S rRNA (cytidine1402-2'-O)-methyltransferase
MSSSGKLYVVATHIGNPQDITLRALQVLKEVDFVICEEYKMGSKLLHQYEITQPMEQLNEHNEDTQTLALLQRILTEGKSAALISDAGTPLFADPGQKLVWQCHQNGVTVVPIPGASSIMAALMGSGIVDNGFLFYGFLPANKDERRSAIKRLPDGFDIILLEAPYRLPQLLRDLKKNLGKQRQAVVAYKLTQPEEKFFWGTLAEIETMTKDLPKGEFVMIIKQLLTHRRY